MKRHVLLTVLVIGVISLLPIGASAQLSYFLDYLYMLEEDSTVFDELMWFWTPDTIYGNMYVNGIFGIKYVPQFMGQVSITGDDFIHGAGYSPWFAYPPQFNAPEVYLPTEHGWLLEAASEQGHAFEADDGQWRDFRCFGTEAGWEIRQYPLESNPDSTDPEWEEIVPYASDLAFYFIGNLYIQGDDIIGGAGICTQGDIYITDNLVYNGVPTNSFTSNLPDTVTSSLGLISGGDILIADTWANGKGNGLYRCSGNFDSANVIITSALVALNESFTFEHQNDTWDDYRWCDLHPGESDERGDISIIGSIAQARRGYLHRSNCNGTGYSSRIRKCYDSRFLTNPPPHMYPDGFLTQVVTWSDTVVHVTDIVDFRHTLILGPGTEIHVDSALSHIFELPDSSRLYIDGTPDNPVVISIDNNEVEEFTLVQETLRIDGLGVISDSAWTGLVIEAPSTPHVNLQIPRNLQDVVVYSRHLTLTPHDSLVVEQQSPVRIEGLIFTGDTLEIMSGNSEHCELSHAEIHGYLISSLSTIENTTFVGTSIGAIENHHHTLSIRNTFFFGYEERLITLFTGAIDYSGYYGFTGDEPFRISMNVGEHMVGEVDPLFVDPENGDYHLQEGSPLIDAGDPASSLDPDGSIADIGAYYFDQLAVDDHDAPQQAIPSSFGIASVFPNPFNPVTQVDISLPQADHVMVEVLDILGRRVALLQDDLMQAGTHSLTFNGAELASGTYFVRLSGRQDTDVSKILLLK